MWLLFHRYGLNRTNVSCFLTVAGVALVNTDDVGFAFILDLEHIGTDLLSGTTSLTSIFIYYGLCHISTSFSLDSIDESRLFSLVITRN